MLVATPWLWCLVVELDIGLLSAHCTAIKVSESARWKGDVEMSGSLKKFHLMVSGRLLHADLVEVLETAKTSTQANPGSRQSVCKRTPMFALGPSVTPARY